jgi:hypothetical protein
MESKYKYGNSMKTERNWIVFIASMIYLLLVVTTLYYTFTGNLSQLIGEETPQWYGYYIYITSIIYIIGFIFILRMKKWSFTTLITITIVLYLSAYFVGVFSIQSLIIDIIIFGAIGTQYKKMK